MQHYKTALSFDWTQKSIAGETTITFRPFGSDVAEIQLDAGEMTIASVKLLSGLPLKFRYEKNEELFVTLDHVYPAEQDVSVIISYSATPKKGLTFIAGTESEPNLPNQIWSQGETGFNHYWFPCYDYPNDKATSELIATAEDKYQVISNGVLVDVRPDTIHKTRTWHWKTDQPHSSYLTSVVVGQFREIRDQLKTVPFISYVYPDQVENGRFSFAKLEKMAAYYAAVVEHDYPYGKYAQVTVRDFNGGMENITATTITDTTVHDRRAHLDISSDELISHELAHSWFGNMITCRDWSDLWLNEGFATFCEALWTEHDLGRDEYLYEMLRNQQTYLHAWQAGNRRPIATRLYADPEALFDVHVYEQPAAVIGLLRFVLGDELFWKAIRHYIQKYQWKNVGTPELIVAIEEATGRNLQWFFDEWIFKMGHPQFDLTTTYDEQARVLKLTVKQTQQPNEKWPPGSSPEFFATPVEISIATASGDKVERVMIDKAQNEFSFHVDSRPLFVNFDRGSYIIKEVKDSFSDEELANQLRLDSDVTGRLRAVAELKSRKSEIAARALSDAARKDRFWGVRFEAATALAEFKNEIARAALIETVKDPDSRVRRAAIKGLAPLRDQKLADLYIRVIDHDQSYFAVSEAAAALGLTGSPRAFDALAKLITQESWQDTIRTGAMSGIALLKDPRSLPLALRYARKGNVQTVRAPAIALLGELGKGNSEAISTLSEALKEEEFDQMMVGAAFSLAKLGDLRALPMLEEFAARSDLPAGARAAVQTAITRLKTEAKEGDKKN
ncbi:MAG TPA: M1 family aminopeptidase [Blastocatellia bacterium]|nr:M1 family aminopeptidase [Blastocatellia bacterium]